MADMRRGVVLVNWEETQWRKKPSTAIDPLLVMPSITEPLHMELRTTPKGLAELAGVLKGIGGRATVKAFAVDIEKSCPRLSSELLQWERSGCKGDIPHFSMPCCVLDTGCRHLP